MSQTNRLSNGGRIDRNKVLTFTFNGQNYKGFEGDSLAAALLANGVDIIGRSFKYSRPRGIFAAGAEEPNAVLQIGATEATQIPNVRATQQALYQGLVATSTNGWPNVNNDVMGILGKVGGKLMPPGFYYKTFMYPQSFWMTYEKYIRKAAGLGRSPTENDPDTYDYMNQHCDVLIVGRGGGSMEDLWAFNEEPVVRAIYASKIPVISAVGHETDFTLADFASDQRAATPSQAAELAVPDRAELLRYTESLMARLAQQAKRQLQEKRLRLDACRRSAALQKPQLLLASRTQRLDHATARLDALMKSQMKEKRHALEIALQQLDYLNPVHILRQGYGIVEKEGSPVTSVCAVHEGDRLTVTLKDGRLTARVESAAGTEGRA